MTKTNKTFAYVVAAVVALVAMSAIVAYAGPWRDPVSVVLKRFYPAVLVKTRVVSVNDLEQGIAVGGSLGSTREQAVAHVFESEKAYVLARRLKVGVDRGRLADEMRFLSQAQSSDYHKLLDDSFNGSEYLYYKYVVAPQAFEAALRVYYNSDFQLNRDSYTKAQQALKRLEAGEKFEDLAAELSDDKLSAQFGGDLGFYEDGQIIPELQGQISISAFGEVRKEILVSRLGYHIIYPIEYAMRDGVKAWHARHMLFATTGYEQWFDQQTRDIKIFTIKAF